MHHHRPSSTLTLKFSDPDNIKEEEESGFESGFDTSDSEGDYEFQEQVVGVQLKKQRMDLDDGSGSKMMSAASGGGRGGGGAVPPQFVCKVDKCQADLSGCKQYHKKHRICEYHSKAEVALVVGLKQRFCQQCSRFHELAEFDDTKRSCRRRLEGHNARRRKSSMAAGFEPKKDDCRIDQERGRITMVCPKNHPKIEIL